MFILSIYLSCGSPFALALDTTTSDLNLSVGGPSLAKTVANSDPAEALRLGNKERQ